MKVVADNIEACDQSRRELALVGFNAYPAGLWFIASTLAQAYL
jgi:hypothetical protein